jgi:cytochrome P450
MTTAGTAGQPADFESTVARFDAYDHEIAQQVFEVTGWARAQCPVARSDAYGGFWLVTSYAEVRQALSDPVTYSSRWGVAFPHKQTVMMPPIDLDPPLQKDFRRLLNGFFSRAGITKYADSIQALAEQAVDAIADRDEIEFMADFAAPFTAAVLSQIILNLTDGELFARARRVTGGIARNDGVPESQKRAELEQIVEQILGQRAESGERVDDTVDALLHGSVEGRPLTRDERVGALMILLMGGLSTTNAAMTSIVKHITEIPGLEDRLRAEEWSRRELDEFLRFEAPVGSLSRTVTTDTVLGDKQLKAGDVVVLHFAAANRDESVFAHADTVDLGREKNPHLAFGLGDHRCIGSNLARMQIDIGMRELLSRIENIRLAPGTVLERESGSGLGWVALPVRFERRAR